ncbi:hypothetical protein BD311DRAFT_761768 [Dichomitus squalens]|uniref:Uncharacterized protein n=1 Tax=Dichomitus squalens TaxID=114155 RepID=A0A4Q9MKW6_9APHY|nr:hypothetical protein BD311DRAFT_761767 [Dichomitus squalens]TBU26722.1 hypothetical protein BD311DRAFT_761768 [Dichomitus squalens]
MRCSHAQSPSPPHPLTPMTSTNGTCPHKPCPRLHIQPSRRTWFSPHPIDEPALRRQCNLRSRAVASSELPSRPLGAMGPFPPHTMFSLTGCLL